ncbi:MAG: GatB/YqeY domain-containing protein [Deltaproteobacteria bacterium]|nr:MAG: GatB/YqeY domain-containing protein [Deltaproteobacteria bacterium]
MPIVDEIPVQLKAAMRAKDSARVGALRNIKAAFLAELKSANAPENLDDAAAITVLRRLAKQRAESIEAYDAGGRDELAAAERAELGVIEEFLPKLADEAQTRAWVEAAIATTGASSMRDMGKVMGVLMKNHRDELDGKLANTVVKELLG